MAGTRQYVRGNNGRFAGAKQGTKVTTGRAGGFANAQFRARVQAGRKANAQTKVANAKSSRPPSRRLSPKTKQRLIVAGVTAGTVVGTRAAVGRALPTQRYKTSKKVVDGPMIKTDVAKGIKVSEVKGVDATYTTRSVVTGRGLGRKTETTTFITKGKNNSLVGMVHSERRVVGAASIKTSYLTGPNRGKGLGSKAVVAHAAHSPNVRHRASITRSLQGQGFAKAMGGAGARSAKSKAAGNALTREMNGQWKYSKFDYDNALKITKTNVSKGTAINVNSLKSKRRRKP